LLLNKKFRIALNLLIIALLFSGCAMFKENAKKQEEAKQKLEKQKKNFFSLQSDLKSHKIEIGTKAEDIKAAYGEPSNTLDSSSHISQFQMWTYEYPDAAQREALQPIRLYFSDGKLSYWSS
jgi:hypothetical protein